MSFIEEIQTRHRRELKDLQSRITQKKKSATKKTRKGINAECEALEHQLQEKQAQELASLNGDITIPPAIDDLPELDDNDSDADGVPALTATLENSTIAEPIQASENGNVHLKKRNRQKERLARRAAEQEEAIAAAQLEAANQPDAKAVEHAKLQAEFKARGLVEWLVRPDGHCLFSAVADQLEQVGIPLGEASDSGMEGKEGRGGERYKVVRRAAARFMEGHPGDFVAWLDEPLEAHVQKIRDTAEWGGHLELLALARTYNVEICVLQAGGAQTIEPGSGAEGKAKTGPEKIWLAYYRHGFGLGEHYNSLRKAP